jgi:hypothetical protein
MRATRRIGVVVAGAAILVAACGGGGGDDKGTTSGGSGSGGSADSAVSHEQMCELAWDDGGKDQAAASGQSKDDYITECIKVMSGATATTAASP